MAKPYTVSTSFHHISHRRRRRRGCRSSSESSRAFLTYILIIHYVTSSRPSDLCAAVLVHWWSSTMNVHTTLPKFNSWRRQRLRMYYKNITYRRERKIIRVLIGVSFYTTLMSAHIYVLQQEINEIHKALCKNRSCGRGKTPHTTHICIFASCIRNSPLVDLS